MPCRLISTTSSPGARLSPTGSSANRAVVSVSLSTENDAASGALRPSTSVAAFRSTVVSTTASPAGGLARCWTNPLPVIVTSVPPKVGPIAGATAVTSTGSTTTNVNSHTSSGSPPVPSRSWSSPSPVADWIAGPIVQAYSPSADCAGMEILSFVALNAATPVAAIAPSGPVNVMSATVKLAASTAWMKSTSSQRTTCAVRPLGCTRQIAKPGRSPKSWFSRSSFTP